jgi:hypothetical protein
MTRVVGALLIASTVLGAQAPSRTLPDPPLPETRPFLEAVAARLARSQDAQRDLAYTERRTELNLNPFGRMGTSGTRVFRMTPASDFPGFTRRLLEKDGAPVANAPLERVQRRAGGSGKRIVDDVAGTLEIRLDRREHLDGRPVVVAVFAPKRDAQPQTRQGRIARVFRGEVWIDEQSRDVMRVDAVATDDITFGFGMIARVNDGARVMVAQTPFDSDVWLPASVHFVGEGRALLFRRLKLDFLVQWFDYQRVR